MLEKDIKNDDTEFPPRDTQTMLTKINQDLIKAIKSNDKQEIWKLSKIITKYQIKSVEIKE